MKIAIDIDNTICNTSDFLGPIAENYDRTILHKNNVINYDKIVPRSDNWTKEELTYFVENYFNKESINIPIKEDAVIYINKLKELGYEIVFITNRGIKEDDRTDLIVPEYLEKNNISFIVFFYRIKKITFIIYCIIYIYFYFHYYSPFIYLILSL